MDENYNSVERQNILASSIVEEISSLFSREKRADFEDDFLTRCDREGLPLESIIRSIVSHGFVLHGSDRKISKLEPRRAGDAERMSGKMEAVFATNQPEIAIFRSIMSYERARNLKPSGNLETYWYIDEKSRYRFGASSQIIDTLDEGYIHIFPQGDFKPVLERERNFKNPLEFIRRSTVKPVAILKVRPEDFYYEIEEIADK